MDTVQFNPNTGAKLSAGQSVTFNGNNYTQGSTAINGTGTGTFKQNETASGVASSLGMTNAQFLSYNPSLAAAGHPNDYQGLTGLVNVGQSYNTGPAKSQVVQTSNASRTNTANNLSTADNAVNSYGIVDNKPTPPPSATADPIITGLQQLQTNSDAVTKSMLASTMATYQNQINAAQKQGDNYRMGLESLGIRTGAAQTTPDILSGHIQAAANDTLAKIGTIQNNMSKALLNIQQAKQAGDFKTIQMETDRYTLLQKQKQDSITQMRDQITFGQKQLTFDAPSLYSSFSTLTSDKDKQAFIEQIAQADGVSPLTVTAALATEQDKESKAATAEQRANMSLELQQKQLDATKAVSAAQTKTDAYGTIENLIGSQGAKDKGVIDKNNFLTPEGLNQLISFGAKNGITKKEILGQYGGKLFGTTDKTGIFTPDPKYKLTTSDTYNI